MLRVEEYRQGSEEGTVYHNPTVIPRRGFKCPGITVSSDYLRKLKPPWPVAVYYKVLYHLAQRRQTHSSHHGSSGRDSEEGPRGTLITVASCCLENYAEY